MSSTHQFCSFWRCTLVQNSSAERNIFPSTKEWEKYCFEPNSSLTKLSLLVAPILRNSKCAIIFTKSQSNGLMQQSVWNMVPKGVVNKIGDIFRNILFIGTQNRARLANGHWPFSAMFRTLYTDFNLHIKSSASRRNSMAVFLIVPIAHSPLSVRLFLLPFFMQMELASESCSPATRRTGEQNNKK